MAPPTNGCVRKALEKDNLCRSFSRQSILLQYSEKHAMFLKLPVRYVKEPSSWARTSSYTSMSKEFASHAREVFTLSLKLWSVRVASTAKDSFLKDARHNMSSPVSGGLFDLLLLAQISMLFFCSRTIWTLFCAC